MCFSPDLLKLQNEISTMDRSMDEKRDKIYTLPLRDELNNHEILTTLFDMVVSKESNALKILQSIKSVCDNCEDDSLNIIKDHPHLAPVIRLDDFADITLDCITDILEKEPELRELLCQHVEILGQNKASILSRESGQRFLEICGDYVTSLTLNFVIFQKFHMSSFSKLLFGDFPNVKALALDLTHCKEENPCKTRYRTRRAGQTTVEMIKNEDWRNLSLPLTRLAFLADFRVGYTQADVECVVQMIAKLIRSSTNLKYLNFDLHLDQYLERLINELKFNDHNKPLETLKSLVITRSEHADIHLGYGNAFTQFLFSPNLHSMQNLYLKDFWNDNANWIPDVPEMPQVKKFCLSGEYLLNKAFPLLKNFPQLKTLVLVCEGSHTLCMCCQKAPGNSLGPEPFSLPSVTLLAMQGPIIPISLPWLKEICSTFPNLKSLTFSLKVIRYEEESRATAQVKFLQDITLYITKLKKLRTLRVGVMAAENLDFDYKESDSNIPAIFGPFEEFLKISELKNFLVDFGFQKEKADHLTHLEEYLKQIRYINIVIMKTRDFCGASNSPHLAYARHIFSNNMNLGFSQKNYDDEEECMLHA